MSNTIKRTINLVLFSVLLFCISGFINTNAAKSKLQPPKVPITKTTKTVKTKSYNVNTNQNAISENDMKAYKKYLNNKYRNKILVKPCISRQIYNNLLADNTEKGV